MPHDHDAVPGVRRFSYVTGDVERAHEVLRQIYVDHRVRLHRPPRDFQYEQDAVDTGPVTLGRLRYKMDVDLFTEPLDRHVFVVVGGGQAESRAGRDSVRAAPGDVFLHPVDRALDHTCRHVDLHTLSLDRRVVTQAAAALTGVEPAGLRFQAMTPVSPGMGRYFRDTVGHLRRLFTGPEEPLRSPLVVRAAVDLVAATALAAFPNTATSAAYRPAPGAVAPAAVRRAVSFIESHAGEPITVATIAEAAQVSARALHAGFRRHLGTTPMAYLRRVRLERAHHDLRAADPGRGDTVSRIAHRWGYATPSKFSADYRAAFGHPPSQTLRA